MCSQQHLLDERCEVRVDPARGQRDHAAGAGALRTDEVDVAPRWKGRNADEEPSAVSRARTERRSGTARCREHHQRAEICVARAAVDCSRAQGRGQAPGRFVVRCSSSEAGTVMARRALLQAVQGSGSVIDRLAGAEMSAAAPPDATGCQGRIEDALALWSGSTTRRSAGRRRWHRPAAPRRMRASCASAVLVRMTSVGPLTIPLRASKWGRRNLDAQMARRRARTPRSPRRLSEPAFPLRRNGPRSEREIVVPPRCWSRCRTGSRPLPVRPSSSSANPALVASAARS